MLFQHLCHDYLSLPSLEYGHQPEAACELLGYPHVDGCQLDCLSGLHAKRGVR
jgi:hypothetical protein